MKPSRPKEFSFSDPVYGLVCWVRVGGSYEEAEEWSDTHIDVAHRKVFGGVDAAAFCNEGEPAACIGFGEKPTPGLVAHEMLHVVVHLMETIGSWPLCSGNEENFAYYLGWGVDPCR